MGVSRMQRQAQTQIPALGNGFQDQGGDGRKGRGLSAKQRKQYETEGYVSGLPVYTQAEMQAHRSHLANLLATLPPSKTAFDINAWHTHDRWLFDVLTHPVLLDYVESIIGPNILLWGSHFFSKAPHDASRVAWHQDARYWPLHPHRTVTVWLAFDDSDVGNGAMRIVPRTQHLGLLDHDSAHASRSVLGLAVGGSAFDPLEAVPIELRAGEISLHNDNLVHGSPGNHSDRRRCGLTARYAPPEVKCDQTVWPKFRSVLVRGEDRLQLNRTVPAPTTAVEIATPDLMALHQDYPTWLNPPTNTPGDEA